MQVIVKAIVRCIGPRVKYIRVYDIVRDCSKNISDLCELCSTHTSNREFEVNLRRRHSGILYIVIDVCIADRA